MIAKKLNSIETRVEARPHKLQQDSAGSLTLLKRFTGYLSGDSLNYFLGFAIYAWLIRCLTNQQYGYLSVATGIYQPFVMVVALGLDLIGPRILAEHHDNTAATVASLQWLKVKFATFVCLPILALIALSYWRAHQPQVCIILVAAFSMIFARAFDVSYVAVALAKPKPLVYSRALGLLFYLALLVACSHLVKSSLWIIPFLNACGVLLGRFLLMRSLHLSMFAVNRGNYESSRLNWRILLSGAKTSTGQLLLFSFQTLDVVLLNRYVDAGTVGQYAMVSRLYLFGTAVLVCVLNAFVPELLQKDSTDGFVYRFQKFVLSSLSIGIIGALMFWTVGVRATELLGSRSLQLLHVLTPIYATVFLVMSVANPFVSFLPLVHREKEYVTVVALAAVVVFTSDLFLIARCGATGAAWGQLFGTVFLALYGSRVMMIYVKEKRKKERSGSADSQDGLRIETLDAIVVVSE